MAHALHITHYAFHLRLQYMLIVFIILAAWTSTIVPLGEGPDELPHFTVTRYIVQQGRLPDTPEEHEAFQPPLYYLLSAALTFWIDTRDFVVKANADYDPIAPDAPKTLLLHTRAEAFPYRGWALAWHLMRGLSVLMGAVTIAAIYQTAKTLSGERTFALVTASLVAFLPGFIFMSSVVNNDNLAAMFAALLCWQIVVLVQSPTCNLQPATCNLPSPILIGLLLGLGLLSKTSMLAFVITLFVALLAAARVHHWLLRDWLRANLVVFGVAALVSGWYFIRNYWLYQDWLAWPLVLAANAVRIAPLTPNDWLNATAQVYRSFWLEWIGIRLEPVVLLVLSLFTALSAAGLAYRLSPCAMRHAPFASAPLILALHFAVIFVSWLRWTQTVLGTEQARLFYPALTTIVLLMALGLRSLHHTLPIALVALLLALALLTPLHYIVPTYAPAPRIAALPGSAQPISASYKGKLRLIGWELPTARVQAGDVLKLGLYWEALRDLQDDDWLRVQLLDAHDNFLLFKDGSPSAGRDSTDSWRRGEKIVSWHRLIIPEDVPRGVYRLTVGVHPYGRKNFFPIEEENMWTALGDQLVLAEVTIE